MQITAIMRYHLTQVSMAIIKNFTNNNWWRECGGKGTLIHCWWECKLVQPLCKTVWRVLKKLKIELLWKWKSLSHVRLLATPWTIYTVYGILQARTLEWVAFPFSRGSSQLRDWTQVSCIVGRFFTSWDIREAIGSNSFSPGRVSRENSNLKRYMLTSLCIIGSSFIHLIRTDSNVFFLMAE